ncbi:placental protein 13-like isoform X3 [Papio anubis]|uniref:placental protein 13-like isoform X3 n=1 Tax=Papio anubis TaxID=9555 RepID=UPI00083E9826|nr:placental protein 13-like isoform X3 [Papio anubis]
MPLIKPSHHCAESTKKAPTYNFCIFRSTRLIEVLLCHHQTSICTPCCPTMGRTGWAGDRFQAPPSKLSLQLEKGLGVKKKLSHNHSYLQVMVNDKQCYSFAHQLPSCYVKMVQVWWDVSLTSMCVCD